MSELGSPELGWKEDKTPVSGRFDDVYYSVDDGQAESLYVFVNGCGLPDAFQGKDSFCVAETGFGTGLNFLLTWKAWKESGTTCRLHFVSVEAFPLTREQLSAAYDTFNGLEEYCEEFLQNYPTLTPGFHHIVLNDGAVKLTLLFGEAADMFSKLEARIDAWYLDGFAPAKNPEMWRAEVFEQIGRLSADAAVVSTFTAAGFVKRGLRDVGFEMSKRKGFGRKRESLIGFYQEQDKKIENPWFSLPVPKLGKQKIAVIGAGVAGCVTARRLMQDGHEVCVFERNDKAGQEGSGNRLGLIKPRLTLEGDFNQSAYLHALRFYDRLGGAVWQGTRGLFQMDEDAEDHVRNRLLMEKEILPSSEMELIDAEEAGKRIGVSASRGGLWFKRAGYVEPSQLCQQLAEQLNVQYGVQITSVDHVNGKWLIKAGQETVLKADCVVLTMAGESNDLLEDCTLPMRGRRGQVSYIKATEVTQKVEHVLSCGGYLIPAQDGAHVVGATFDHWTDFSDHSYRELDEESHQQNLEKWRSFFPNEAATVEGGRASIRATSPDHMPIVGPVFSRQDYIERYERLKHGRRAGIFEPAGYIDGLYVICGLGARGVQTAPLLSDVISAYIKGTPSPVSKETREALHPARFLIRQLKKGKI